MRLQLFIIAILVIHVRHSFAQTEDLKQSTFHLNANFYGPHGYTDPAADKNYRNHMANGFSFMAPADPLMLQFLKSHPGDFVFELYGAARVTGWSASDIEAQRQAAASFCSIVGAENCAWNAMGEWDQSGGHWVRPHRPSYIGLTRDQAFSLFKEYYLDNSQPLGRYLRQTLDERGIRLIAQTDYVPNVFYAYAFGADMVLLERSLDELGDTSTGVAFVRGASRQNDKPWGIDISTWRTFCNSETRFNPSGILECGWSPSYLRRQFYASYLSGANVLQIEPTAYYDAVGDLNPFGAAVREFGDFALVRHPDVGRTAVSIAIMIPFHSGFDTRHGFYNQRHAVWYQDIPYNSGDFMLNNLLSVAYPNHWLHGTMPCPFKTSAGYSAYLAKGGDPRPCEVMPFTRWGDNLDVITDNAPATALNQYKAIILAGDIVLSAELRSTLQSWVQQGGTLILNSSQISKQDWSWLGISLGVQITARASRWLPSKAESVEEEFAYPTLTPTTASVLATTRSGKALITANEFGQGRVLFTAPPYLLNRAKTKLLNIGIQLVDWLNNQYAIATVAGPQIEYVVNQRADTTIVGLINNSGTPWSGNIAFKRLGSVESASELVSDSPTPIADHGGVITLAAQVPSYDLKIFAVHFGNANSVTSSQR